MRGANGAQRSSHPSATYNFERVGYPGPGVGWRQAQLRAHFRRSSTSPDGRPDPKLKVTLVYVTPDTFTVGDRVVFELLIDHVGDAPVPLAISRNITLAPGCRNAPGDVRTSFSLFSKGSHEVIASGPGLYGERAAAATTMMLNPGERLRVRVPATICYGHFGCCTLFVIERVEELAPLNARSRGR